MAAADADDRRKANEARPDLLLTASQGERVLADRQRFPVEDDQWERFDSNLEGPVEADDRLASLIVKPFDEIWTLDEERSLSSRTAAFIIACKRVLAAREQRGLYP